MTDIYFMEEPVEEPAVPEAPDEVEDDEVEKEAV